MSDFTEFVRGFCVIAVAGGLVLSASSDGNLKKHVKFVISLCMVCALLSAVFTFAEKTENFFENIQIDVEDESEKTQTSIKSSVITEAKKNIEKELCALLSERLGVSENDIYVVAEIDTEDFAAVKITKINVFLKDMTHESAAREYVSEIFLGSVKIDILQKGE